MKVSELIELLQDQEQNADVVSLVKMGNVDACGEPVAVESDENAVYIIS